VIHVLYSFSVLIKRSLFRSLVSVSDLFRDNIIELRRVLSDVDDMNEKLVVIEEYTMTLR